jgi:MFS family permease
MTSEAAAVSNPSIRSPGHSPLPGARMALILLLTINLFNYIDRQVLAAVEPRIEKEFFPEGTDQQNVQAKMGSLQTAFMLTYMLVAPVFGWLADRRSRWFLIGVGVILWSLASGASGLASTFAILLFTRCFVGIGEAAYGPAAPTILSDLYPVKVRGQVMAWFYAAIPVGSALGYVVGGAIVSLGDWMGNTTDSWRWAFYAVLPPGALLGILCFFMREPPRGQADGVKQGDHPRPRLADAQVLLRTPSYVLCTLGMTAMTFAMGGLGFWIPKYIYINKQAPNLAQVSYIFGGIVVVSGLVATLLGGYLGDKLRSRFSGSYFLVSGISMIIGFPMVLLVLWSSSPWGYWTFTFIACFCLFFNTGPMNTVLANVSHPAIRSSAYAINIFVIHALGDAISPALIGYIADLSSMDVGFGVVSLMFLVSGVLWLTGVRFLERDTARAPRSLDASRKGS